MSPLPLSMGGIVDMGIGSFVRLFELVDEVGGGLGFRVGSHLDTSQPDSIPPLAGSHPDHGARTGHRPIRTANNVLVCSPSTTKEHTQFLCGIKFSSMLLGYELEDSLAEFRRPLPCSGAM